MRSAGRESTTLFGPIGHPYPSIRAGRDRRLLAAGAGQMRQSERMSGEEVGTVTIRDMTPVDAATVATWRYDGPWSVYDVRDSATAVMTSESGYFAIADANTDALRGYICVGGEARVPGLSEEPEVLDVGIGLDPSVVGRGRGRSIVGPALRWVEDRYGGLEMRSVVQSWNERSLRLCHRLGFTVGGHHSVDQQGAVVKYTILRRPAGKTP